MEEFLRGGTKRLSERRKPPAKFQDTGGQYTRHGSHGMAYGSRGYLDAQRGAGFPPFGRRRDFDDSPHRKNYPSGSGYGRLSRGAAGSAKRAARRAVGLGIGAGLKSLSGGLSVGFDLLNPFPVDPSFGIGSFADPDGRMEPKFPPGASCISYRDSGIHSASCSNKYYSAHAGPNTNAVDCNTWHYLAQPFIWDGENPATYKPYIFAGPVLEGIYGCQRFNYDWVAKYPAGKGPTTKVEWVPKTETRVLPQPATAYRPMPPAFWETANGDVEDTRPVDNQPRFPRYAEPSLDIAIGPRTGPRTRLKPKAGSHIRRPPNGEVGPGPAEKEKKGRASLGAAMGALSKLYGGTTEAYDATKAIAANTKGCEKVRGIIAQLNCIYDNLDKLDITGALADLLINEAEDRQIGKFHGALKKGKAPFGSSMYTGYMR